MALRFAFRMSPLTAGTVGKWLARCGVDYHVAAGMAARIDVTPVQARRSRALPLVSLFSAGFCLRDDNRRPHNALPLSDEPTSPRRRIPFRPPPSSITTTGRSTSSSCK